MGSGQPVPDCQRKRADLPNRSRYACSVKVRWGRKRPLTPTTSRTWGPLPPTSGTLSPRERAGYSTSNPLPWGEGGPQPAPLPAGAGRVRGFFVGNAFEAWRGASSGTLTEPRRRAGADRFLKVCGRFPITNQKPLTYQTGPRYACFVSSPFAVALSLLNSDHLSKLLFDLCSDWREVFNEMHRRLRPLFPSPGHPRWVCSHLNPGFRKLVKGCINIPTESLLKVNSLHTEVLAKLATPLRRLFSLLILDRFQDEINYDTITACQGHDISIGNSSRKRKQSLPKPPISGS